MTGTGLKNLFPVESIPLREGEPFVINKEDLGTGKIDFQELMPTIHVPFILRNRDNDEVIIFVGEHKIYHFKNAGELEKLSDAILSDGFPDNNLPRFVCSIKFPGELDNGQPRISGKIIEPLGVLSINSESITGILYDNDSAESEPVLLDTLKSVIEMVTDSSLIKIDNESDLSSILLKSIAENKADWDSGFFQAMNGFSTGEYKKIVLSRKRDYGMSGELSVVSLWNKIRGLKQSNYKFVINLHDRLLFGSSPERLFKKEGSTIYTEALAGTFIDDDSDPDREKNYYEHILVRDHIFAQLKGTASRIQYPDSPKIRKYEKINHYLTPITAVTESVCSYIDFLKLLFPTPATAGYPVNSVINKIAEIESYQREYYAGLTGIVRGNGDAEFFVNLRCGQVKNDMISFYAGCGIVEGSESEKEYTESELKMKTMMSLFGL